jgi:hypothetical protein
LFFAFAQSAQLAQSAQSALALLAQLALAQSALLAQLARAVAGRLRPLGSTWVESFEWVARAVDSCCYDEFQQLSQIQQCSVKKKVKKEAQLFFFSVARHKSVQKRTKTWQLVATCRDLINQDCFLLLFLSLSLSLSLSLFPCVS